MQIIIPSLHAIFYQVVKNKLIFSLFSIKMAVALDAIC